MTRRVLRFTVPLLLILILAAVIPSVRADIIDSYDLSHQNSTGQQMTGGPGTGNGQCFRPSVDAIISSAGIALHRVGSPTGIFRYDIFSTSGAYGSTCIPSAFTPTLVSDTFSAADVPLTFSIFQKSFSGVNQAALVANTPYALMVEYVSGSAGDSLNYVQVGLDTAGSHPGNAFHYFTGIYGADATFDDPFAVFGTGSTTPGQSFSCFGNCAPITNTNSTHSINFNGTQTLFYPVQSSLNGFVRNVTTVVAKSYSNGMNLYLGLYTVDLSCTSNGGQPFSAQCPAFLSQSSIITNPSKGVQAMTSSRAVLNRQWLAIAISGSFTGLDLNDTTTATPIYSVSGILPTVITGYTNLGPSKIALYAGISGFSEGTNGGSAVPSGCSSIPCGVVGLVEILGGGVFGGLVAFGIFFGGITFGLIYIGRQHNSEGHIVGHAFGSMLTPFLVLLGIVLMLAMSAIGALPAYIPLAIIAFAAWLFTKSIWGGHGNGNRDEG